MNKKVSVICRLGAVVFLLSLVCTHSSFAEDALKAEALLIWGTDAPQSPDPKHVPVDETLALKLGKSPYRWKHYYVVNRELLDVPVGGARKGIAMSKHCVLDVANLGGDHLELKLFGDGNLLSRHKESFAGNCTLVIAGPAENQTAWLVVVRKVRPVEKLTRP